MPAASSRPRRPEALHEQIARNIRNAIEAGVLRHGEALPSTRELAGQWKTSVFTINEAMTRLAEEGLVVATARSKRVVHAPDQGARAELRTRQPQVIYIGGYAGSGKTELGRILARETGWAILDKDTMTRPVVEVALETLGMPPYDRESATYVDVVRPREYEALSAAIAENVECGVSVIATAPFIQEFNDPAWLDRTQAMGADLDAATTFVWVYCDPDTMHTYIRHRGAARDAGKLNDWPGYVAALDIDFRPSVPHVVVDNSAASTTLQAQARKLVRQLAGQADA